MARIIKSTCLVCDNEAPPAYLPLCPEHRWIVNVEAQLDNVMVALYTGDKQRALDALREAERLVRERCPHCDAKVEEL